jgi:hypothetical protein
MRRYGSLYGSCRAVPICHRAVGRRYTGSWPRPLLVAYAWMGLGAALLIGWDFLPATAKDMTYHAIGLGFIFTMILAHAPVILPAVSGGAPVRRVPVGLFALCQGMTVLHLIGDAVVAKAPDLWV